MSPLLPERSRFAVGDTARILHTSVTFEVTRVSPDGETIEGHPCGHGVIARFCERIRKGDVS